MFDWCSFLLCNYQSKNKKLISPVIEKKLDNIWTCSGFPSATINTYTNGGGYQNRNFHNVVTDQISNVRRLLVLSNSKCNSKNNTTHVKRKLSKRNSFSERFLNAHTDLVCDINDQQHYGRGSKLFWVSFNFK